ncbi:hypothetical protein DL770_003532 [Monosporascus sp. CRB-9-2]|nr:hypothetical protein DL770_003532 [Monosporascus sp. CRB-9-2]
MDVLQEKSELTTRICSQVTKDFIVSGAEVKGMPGFRDAYGGVDDLVYLDKGVRLQSDGWASVLTLDGRLPWKVNCKPDGNHEMGYHVEHNCNPTIRFKNMLKSEDSELVFDVIQTARTAKSKEDMERAITGCMNLMVIHGTFGRPGGCVSKASFFQAQPLERIEQMELTYTTGAFTDEGAAYLRTPTRNSRYGSKRTAAQIGALAAARLVASSLGLYTLRRESGSTIFWPFSLSSKALTVDVWTPKICQAWLEQELGGLRRKYDEDLDGANDEMSSERLMKGLFYDKMHTEAARRVRRGFHGPQFQAEHFRQLDHRPAIDYRKPFWTELYVKPFDVSGLADEELPSSDSEDDCKIPATFYRLNSGGKTTADLNDRREKRGDRRRKRDRGDTKGQEN